MLGILGVSLMLMAKAGAEGSHGWLPGGTCVRLRQQVQKLAAWFHGSRTVSAPGWLPSPVQEESLERRGEAWTWRCSGRSGCQRRVFSFLCGRMWHWPILKVANSTQMPGPPRPSPAHCIHWALTPHTLQVPASSSPLLPQPFHPTPDLMAPFLRPSLSQLRTLFPVPLLPVPRAQMGPGWSPAHRPQ